MGDRNQRPSLPQAGTKQAADLVENSLSRTASHRQRARACLPAPEEIVVEGKLPLPVLWKPGSVKGKDIGGVAFYLRIFPFIEVGWSGLLLGKSWSDGT